MSFDRTTHIATCVCGLSPYRSINHHAISNQREKRGIVCASITRLGSRLKELEDKADQPTTRDLAQCMATRLETLDSDYKAHHFSLIDLIDGEDTLRSEQETLDGHDNDITALDAHIQQLIAICSTMPTSSDQRKVLSRKLQHFEKTLSLVSENISSLSGWPEDICCLQQHEEQLSDYKRDLSDLRNSLLSSDLDESDELITLHACLEKWLLIIILSRSRNYYHPPPPLMSLPLLLLLLTAREKGY